MPRKYTPVDVEPGTTIVIAQHPKTRQWWASIVPDCRDMAIDTEVNTALQDFCATDEPPTLPDRVRVTVAVESDGRPTRIAEGATRFEALHRLLAVSIDLLTDDDQKAM